MICLLRNTFYLYKLIKKKTKLNFKSRMPQKSKEEKEEFISKSIETMTLSKK